MDFEDEELESPVAEVLDVPESEEPDPEEPEGAPVLPPAAAASFEPDSDPPDFAAAREPPEERESVA